MSERSERVAPTTLALVGPTASGKSALALALARRHPGVEVVSADAIAVYRGMDIGTAKPTAAERAEVPHHLLDVVDPGEDFSVARFATAARTALADITGRSRSALVVGGTGLYLRAVTDELALPGRFPDVRAELEGEPDTAALFARLARADPVAATRIDPGNRRRILRALEVTLGSGSPFSSSGPGLDVYPPTSITQIGLRLPLEVLDRRIAGRVAAMVEAGLVEEVAALAERPGGLSRTAREALGYREVLAHLDGACTLEAAVEETVRRTRRFARRQLRWFRRDPRVAWLPPEEESVADRVERLGQWLTCA